VGKRWSWVAWSMLAVFAVSLVVGLPLAVANGTFQQDAGNQILLFLGFSAFMVVGALVVAHRPNNAIGWLFSASALLAVTGQLAGQYAIYGYATRPGSLPGATLALWYGSWPWVLILALTLIFTPLLFPTGRLLSPRWRPVAWLAGVATAVLTTLNSLRTNLSLGTVPDQVIANPIGVAAVGNPDKGPAVPALILLLTVLAAVAFGSLVVRFRRSRGEERQQLKWFTYAAALVPLSVLGDALPAVVGDLAIDLPIVFLPVAAGIAILRYRLYDIDRLINRTLVYGLLTALLAGVYAGAVLVLGQLFGGVRRDPPNWRWLVRPWPWPPCSSRPAAASNRWWIGVSTAASTTPSRPSRRSPPACATRSTSTPSAASCWRSWTRPCSRPGSCSGFDPPAGFLGQSRQ
jgi:hypothetical protein